MIIKRGDIVMADMQEVSCGSIQKYRRPYLIISNNKANMYSPVVTAVALSSKTWKKAYLPVHCIIRKDCIKTIKEDFGVRDSVALCEQIVSIDKSQIEEVVARVTNRNTMKYLNRCIRNQVGLNNQFNK
ncbi:MAG: type II toxin-antitoxin system PemK/MazF family toxin [Lachnospiraceae bacterium]|nr:type II toxin-antitoxin system PemK/MazF family toxin [Lachnospiraceae bacterium]